MKTIEEAANDHGVLCNTKLIQTNGDSFEKGVEFAQTWIPVEEELPIAFESGGWDGLRSEFVIAKREDGEWYKARIYSGIMDGSKFCEWCDEDDFLITNVISWRPTERF